ncbi:MAG: CpaF family protein [Bdellovibrionaceae bacterium]|nr:CpaF family protein [Pseudobdellovibrionaceae bacterium]NUM57985.1 CpaF family protein [Pseudobdellovibrionaceae bacterium]
MSVASIKNQNASDWKNEAGPIKKYFNDITVTEIMINRYDKIFIERKGILEEVEGKFDNPEHLVRFVQALAVNVGRDLNRKNPFMDARLPDGSRVNIVIPPVSVDNPMVTIRKFSPMMVSYTNLLSYGAFDEKILYFINQAVVARQNIIISGGTGSGKTTILNLLSQFIPAKERVVTLEDTVELQMNVKNVVRMECRSFLSDSHFEIKDLLRNALRMRPDRLIIGEVRGGEAFDMLIAMNTGHEGSMSTLHSNSAFDALRRIEAMVLRGTQDIPIQTVKDDIAKTINIIIQTERFSDGSRRISEVVEVDGRTTQDYTINKIFEFNELDKKFTSLGYVPKFVTDSRNPRIKFPQGFFEPDHVIKLS